MHSDPAAYAARQTRNPYDNCELCPRRCGVNRSIGELGFCKETSRLRVASAGLHFGEEPPISKNGGSGAIFISGCSLRCSFCQNGQISRAGMGREVSIVEFADICLRLQSAGAENVNIVTGSHAAPAVCEALTEAKARGLTVPIVWNSSGYETEESIARLSDFVDVWLPDIKTLDPQTSRSFFRADDYPDVVKKAILGAAKRAPPRYGEDGTLKSGLIVRHLMLPGRLDDSRAILKWFSKELAGKALFSLMTQYTPAVTDSDNGGANAPENRPINETEYTAARSMLEEFGVDGFYQELETDSSWTPDFSRVNPFLSSLAKPVWHWKTGMID